MTRTHEYEVVETPTRKVLANMWWDGKRVQTDNASLLNQANRQYPLGKSVGDGIEFLEALPYAFRNGYIVAREKKG